MAIGCKINLNYAYHCTITALLTCGDEVVAREFDF